MQIAELRATLVSQMMKEEILWYSTLHPPIHSTFQLLKVGMKWPILTPTKISLPHQRLHYTIFTEPTQNHPPALN